jgi:glycosyltransferase involved in cell wall biosynthesis
MSAMSDHRPHVMILGIRGVPAAHGGFETFAEKLALFLVHRGWRVTVYCQSDVDVVRQRFRFDTWSGIDRVHVETAGHGPRGTIEFDWHATRHAARQDGVCLVLGYNTAVFLPLLRLRGKKILINMDGFEWRRAKWSLPIRAWFYLNEWLGAWLGHRLIADHPQIADHLATRRSRRHITMIPYGGVEVTSAPAAEIEEYGLRPGQYLIIIARIEPENSILPMVTAFSRRRRGVKLAVLGNLDSGNPYHMAVKAAASDEVQFLGAIYGKEKVSALRFHARAYLHGHSVGGTNPSLVEALWSGNAVLAHRNVFNVWTAGSGQYFFSDVNECDQQIGRLIAEDIGVGLAKRRARQRAVEMFRWQDVLSAYERELATLVGYEVQSEAAEKTASR